MKLFNGLGPSLVVVAVFPTFPFTMSPKWRLASDPYSVRDIYNNHTVLAGLTMCHTFIV